MSDQPGLELANQASRIFREMAEAIDRNAAAFAGAFVVFGPDGQIKKMLLVNDQAEPAMFWSNAEMMCKMAIADIEEKSALNKRNW